MGTWTGGGGTGDIVLYAFRPSSGRSAETQISLSAGVHEVAHHVNEASRVNFSASYYQALKAQGNGYPTTYSSSGKADFLAENTTVMLIGGRADREFPSMLLRSYAPSNQSLQLFQTEFGKPAAI